MACSHAFRNTIRSALYLTFLLAGVLLGLFSCDREEPMPKLEGFSIYWKQEIFGRQGRSYLFSFTATNWMENKYDFIFLPEVKKNEITFILARSVDKGKCPQYPMPSPAPGPPLGHCQSWGAIEIPEAWLTEQQYRIKVVTPFFTQEAELTIEDGRTTLFISENAHLSSAIQEIYPLPPDLLRGSIVFSGEENKAAALAFKEDLVKLGLKETTLSADRYYGIGEDGGPVDSFWEPDNHSLGLLYTLSVDMQQVVEMATEHFESSELNIYLYSTNGDEARFSQREGIRVSYARKPS